MHISVFLRCGVLLAVLGAGVPVSFAQDAPTYKISVFFPDTVDQAVLTASIDATRAPDFTALYHAIGPDDWLSTPNLVKQVLQLATADKADGVFLACKRDSLAQIYSDVQAALPKVPFVDTIAPSMMAANIISSRYYVMSGKVPTSGASAPELSMAQALGIDNHLLLGATKPGQYLMGFQDFDINAKPSDVAPVIVSQTQSKISSDSTTGAVTGIEAIALTGCEGFLDPAIADAVQDQFQSRTPAILMEVIHPIKAAIGLLQSMIRTKLWISVPPES